MGGEEGRRLRVRLRDTLGTRGERDGKVLRLRGRTGMQENWLCGENSSKGKMYE